MSGPREAPTLSGSVRVPGDKSIGHRALILAALAEGTSRISHLSSGADIASTLTCLRALGVSIVTDPAAPGQAVVEGVGLSGLRPPAADLDCGNSGTTARLLAGVLAGAGVPARLVGDASLSERPMLRILAPLRRMGARITGTDRGGRLCLPLTLAGGTLEGADHRTKVASAQVKSALLLAGLRARGRTSVTEPSRSRDHTERMLRARGVPVPEEGGRIWVDGPVERLSPLDVDVPGDPSSAAFLLIAAILAGRASEVAVPEVCQNPTRAGFVEVLRRMGADVSAAEVSERGGEPVGTLIARGGRSLAATEVGPSEVAGLLDEVPILAAAAAHAVGETRFDGVAELRVKESDRLAAVVAMLRAFGVDARCGEDWLMVDGRGGAHLEPPTSPVRTEGDHRIAMAATVLGLTAGGCELDDPRCVEVSYPGFYDDLAALGAPA